MSYQDCDRSKNDVLERLIGRPLPEEGESAELGGEAYLRVDGILRQERVISSRQKQTKDTFGYKWKKRETFESQTSLARMRDWLHERYGDVANAKWWTEYGSCPVVVDAGCGAGMSGLEVFAPIMGRIDYVGIDISEAVDVAAARCEEQSLPANFLQGDVTRLPFGKASVDVIFSEGVLHHTDSTERALKSLAKYLRPGGRFLFYVYRKKGPVREFTDDYIRERISGLTSDRAWDLLMPLTKLGKALGETGASVNVPEDIELLGIPKGEISVQRLFYWHVLKCFYREDLDLGEMNHINFDWFAPENAHRQTIDDVRTWCSDSDLEIEREVLENAGITIIAKKR